MKQKVITGEEYVADVFRQRSSTNRFGARELPLSTRKKIIDVFCFPLGQDTFYLMTTADMMGLAPMFADSFLKDYGNELKEIFEALFSEASINLFIEEIGFIYSAFLYARPRPTKKDLVAIGSSAIELMHEHLVAVETHYRKLKEKPEWPHINAAIFKAHMQNTASTVIPFPIQDFFRWVTEFNMALETLKKGDPAKTDYDAHGRLQEPRNNALIALAGAYHRCFGVIPTSSQSKRSASFYTIVDKFLEFARYELGKECSEDTKIDLIKTAIREYRVSLGE